MEELKLAKTPLHVTLIFYALGISSMLGWTFFITADAYWQYKLRNATLGDDWDDPDVDLTTLQVSFMPILIFVSNTFATLFFFINSFIVKRVSEGERHLGSIWVSLVAMLIVTILTFVNTDSWQGVFFVVTMVISAVLNACMAVLQSSLFGLAGIFPMSCMSSLVSGQAISGVFSSLARIVSLLVAEEPVTSGFVYFTISDVFYLVSIGSYIYLTRGDYYAKVMSEAQTKELPKEVLEPQEKGEWATYWTVLKKVWLMGASLFWAITLIVMVYPSLLVYVTSVYPESRWTKEFFQPTITFLLYNVCDWLGREATRWCTWPGPHGSTLHLLGAARLVFVPLFLLCHGDNKTFPTLLDHDAYYIVILMLFAFSGGYLSTLTFIFYPSLLEKEEVELGGAIMSNFMAVALVLGALLAGGLVALWGPK